jgi:heme/copper-type cytochrome/quinol oxidase subunit 2
MSRFTSPKLARNKAERLQRERRKETGFLVSVIVLMVVVAVAYGVWAIKYRKPRANHPHQHRETKSEKKPDAQ